MYPLRNGRSMRSRYRLNQLQPTDTTRPTSLKRYMIEKLLKAAYWLIEAGAATAKIIGKGCCGIFAKLLATVDKLLSYKSFGIDLGYRESGHRYIPAS